MKTKLFLTTGLLSLAMSASAQIQLLYQDMGRHVIDRNKKLYWMDGDSDPCFDILNYKKAGSKETFTLKSKDDPNDKYSVTILLDDKSLPKQITLTSKNYGTQTSSVETTSGRVEEDNRLIEYFNGLAGNPAKQGVKEEPVSIAPASVSSAGVPSASEGKTTVQGKVKDTANKAFGKVKGLFKKKK